LWQTVATVMLSIAVAVHSWTKEHIKQTNMMINSYVSLTYNLDCQGEIWNLNFICYKKIMCCTSTLYYNILPLLTLEISESQA
jgi:hypothetical protein